jgi:hypothetical protein
MDVPAPWLMMGWNSSPDLSAILQEIIDGQGWRAGNAIALFAEETSDAGKRGVYMIEKGGVYAARLHVTYTISKIDFDTDGDGLPDITMKDIDGDGYFECPVGKTEYSGTLTIIGHKLEIMGVDVTRTETNFKGDGFVLKDGAEIISDLTSPIVSSAHPALEGNDLWVVARNYIWIEYGAKILLGGINEELDGDIYLETTRNGADVVIKEDAAVHGRHIDMITNGGAISLRRNTVFNANSDIKFRAEAGGDIRLNRDVSLHASSVDGDVYITFTAKEGDLHMNRNISIFADVIDFCGIDGNIWDDGTVNITGTTNCW